MQLVIGFVALIGAALLLTSAVTDASFADVISGKAGAAFRSNEAASSSSSSSSGATGSAAAQGSAGAAASLAGISTSPGPVAGSSIPLASWNPLRKPIADWIIPVLQWASQHGWTGTVTSGYRSEAEQAAINAEGLFSAPAGSSNHETTTYPGGAVDVTDPSQLISVLKGYTGVDKLIGGVLGAVDPEHFSATGH
jgi:hypothetical protein